MERILIIKNNHDLDVELQRQLEESYQIHLAKDAFEGQTIINKNYIDVSIIISDNHIEEDTWSFIKMLHVEQSELSPIIFISNEVSKELQAHLCVTYGWFFTSSPIEHEILMEIISKAMEIAQVINEKSIRLKKKKGHSFAYKYKLKDISRIERSRDRTIKIYASNSFYGEELEFFYPFPLQEFLVEHGIEKEFKQAHQSWLVNVSHVRKIFLTDLKLILADGTVVPSSRKFIGQFKEK